MDARLPARLEVMALIRSVEASGGFGTVVHKGEPDAGSLLVVLVENGANARVYERMPQLDGTRRWHCAKRDSQTETVVPEYLSRRTAQDPDLWVVELDIADGERFIP